MTPQTVKPTVLPADLQQRIEELEREVRTLTRENVCLVALVNKIGTKAHTFNEDLADTIDAAKHKIPDTLERWTNQKK